MADEPATNPPSLADLQHWTWVAGRAQQMAMESGFAFPPAAKPNDAQARWAANAWQQGVTFWTKLLTSPPDTPDTALDKRFKDDAWREPWFDWVRRSYLAIANQMLGAVDALEGVEPKRRAQLRFAAQAMVDAMSPTNFALTNPKVIERAIETKGESLLAGLKNMLADLARGQITHSAPGAFELGRNLATTPGKVIKRTPLYELIHYAPTTEKLLATPLVIFPPWINRFYILDLTPEKSFIRWCVDQGISVFIVSWRSADASMAEVIWGDYVAAQIEAMDSVRALLAVPAVHTIGYCVAGTTLAATLALLTARGEADKVASATFFTAQVDFARPGDLGHFIDDEQLGMIAHLSPDGFLDGRMMAASFNLLRGRDLIWTYVTNNYLLGQDHPPFDLLHWNGDTTNLPAAGHLGYLRDIYRDNLLVAPGALSIDGTPLDLRVVTTPTYVQAGRDDHIAPAESVWAITQLFAGPITFVLAGSGHIAGVINPPAAGKYQYWTSDYAATTLAAFVEQATETKGSWWPHWVAWLRAHDSSEVTAQGARRPGEGALAALTDAPGDYVRQR